MPLPHTLKLTGTATATAFLVHPLVRPVERMPTPAVRPLCNSTMHVLAATDEVEMQWIDTETVAT